MRRVAVRYLLLQGGAVIAWWVALAVRPAWRAGFLPPGVPEALLLAWLPGDLLLLAGGSLMAARLVHRRHDLAVPVLFTVSGAVLCASLATLALALLADGGWLGAALMLPPALLTALLALSVSGLGPATFRQAAAAGPRRNLLKTVAQIVVFWTTFLLVLPLLVVALEERLGIERLSSAGLRAAGGALLLAASALGLLCGALVAVRGAGTPLPTDSPRHLVVSGPYAFVRNPMAISGLGQGLAVALLLGSPLVLLYVLLGGAIWQCLARPLEEDDLLHHFGSEYEAYRAAVRCWWPRRTPYRGAAPADDEE